MITTRDEKMEESENVIALVMWRLADLTVRQDRIKDPEVSMSQGVGRGRIVWKVDEIAENDID
jgi:hypothetical protein